MVSSVARMTWPDAKVVHYYPGPSDLKKWSAETSPSYAAVSSIGVVFSGRCEAIVATGTREKMQTVSPERISLCGPEPVAWLSGQGSAEFIEISAEPSFRRDVAGEFGVPGDVDLKEAWGLNDPIIWTVASRFRAAARNAIEFSDVERDTLLRVLYGRVFERWHGGRLPGRGSGRLDEIRLRRVLDFIEAYLETEITLADLAEAAALTPYHFSRAFRLASGATPYAYLRARRLERARCLLWAGEDVRSAAQRIGYASLSHFHAAYRAHFGHNCHLDRQRQR
jgi:AraC family transcriptional regulator